MREIQRTLVPQIVRRLFKGKVVVVYGARQVGKTTLARQIQAQLNVASLYLNCDEPDVRAELTDATSTTLAALTRGKRLVVIDEAQRVRTMGLTLKLLVDNVPHVQVLATGSSAFQLSQQIAEPLTGRCHVFHLHPFSLEELGQWYDARERHRLLERCMVYGMYPEVVRQGADAPALLKSLSGAYLYKDVLSHEGLRRSDLLERLLTALALQLGQEVAYTELASALGVSKQTIERYVDILEQSFIVMRVRPLCRNPRTELRKLRKIYFHDNGIRNALINNLNPLALRQDIGALWENFMVSERMKANHNHGRTPAIHFWRTLQQQEIDYLEVEGGHVRAYEFKWRDSKFTVPKAFRAAYPHDHVDLITSSTYARFLHVS
jgi:predicted AAA+ superfamily ATPase